jgi:CRP/FNR family transcriptional regulator, cyclic AMP receptor protein
MIESDYLKDNIKIIEKIKKIPTLDSFSDQNIKDLLNVSKIRKYEPDELILEEGNYDSWIYFLVSGKIKIAKHNEDLTVLKRTGDIFGEMGIIDGSPRSASVYAVEETVCLATDASFIDRLSGSDKAAFSYMLYRIFSQILAGRLRVTSDELIKAKEEIEALKHKNRNIFID